MKQVRAGTTCVALAARGLFFSLLAACMVPPAVAADNAAGVAYSAAVPKRAEFESEHASREARHVADWVVHAGDNRTGDKRAGDNGAADSGALPFVIVDKRDAKLFVFDPSGRLIGASAALLGMGRGDIALPGIGDRALATIRPADRSTPAGRFVAALGVDTHGDDVLWVDYDGGVAIHRVIATNPKERRLQRLATATPVDNRISFGCINIPVKFYEGVVQPVFTGTYGIVYVLPENKPARKVFASYDVGGPDQQEASRKAKGPLFKAATPAAKR